MSPRRSVLIVDRSEETREVLSTALARRGLCSLSASRADRGLALMRLHRPDVVVVDLESGANLAATVEAFSALSAEQAGALVVIGSVRPQLGGSSAGQFVRKPYHFGVLVRKIEQMLNAAAVETYARSA